MELVSFTASLDPQQTHVNLDWVTATEQGSDYFILEKRRADGSFQSVGRAKGAVNSTESLTYRLVDKNPLNGISYYRLKQVNIDGSFSVSKTVSISTEKGTKVHIYPTFTEGVLSIDIGGGVLEDVQIFNAVGQLVVHSAALRLDLSAFPTGTYLVRVTTGGGEQSVQKVIKR